MNKKNIVQIAVFLSLVVSGHLLASNAHAAQINVSPSITIQAQDVSSATVNAGDITQSANIVKDISPVSTSINTIAENGILYSNSARLHDLEFVNAPLYYSSDCNCRHEDAPQSPFHESSPIPTFTLPAMNSGLSLLPYSITMYIPASVSYVITNLLVIALFGNIMMLLLHAYLRLRSGRSPGIGIPCNVIPHL